MERSGGGRAYWWVTYAASRAKLLEDSRTRGGLRSGLPGMRATGMRAGGQRRLASGSSRSGWQCETGASLLGPKEGTGLECTELDRHWGGRSLTKISK